MSLLLLRRFAFRASSADLTGFAQQKPLAIPTWKSQIEHASPKHSSHRFASSRSSSSGSLKMHNTLTGQLEAVEKPTSSTHPDACYICGPTVYAPAHLGHARTYVWLDIFRRVWQATTRKSPPLFVMNITDVDDKILAVAAERNESPLDLARRYEAEFWKDWDALNCLRPHVVTRVTEHVDSDIVPYIKRLVETGMAYFVQDDGVYFDVRAYEDRMQRVGSRYGKLAPPAQATDFFQVDEDKTNTNNSKRDPRDFALWKLRKEGEQMHWRSPWGDGRPGWHIECSAMIEAVQSHFKDDYEFSFHAGGVDLQFPHHTNEIAQAEAYHAETLSRGQEWISHWIHTGHLHINGLKMSKSLKNFVTIEEILQEDGQGSALSSPADDFRLWCLGLSGSYRGPATYSKEHLEHGRRIRQKVVRFLLDAQDWLSKTNDYTPKKWSERDRVLFSTVSTNSKKGMDALLSDLNGSVFLEAMVETAEEGSKYLAHTGPDTAPREVIQAVLKKLRGMLELVGLSESTCRAGLSSMEDSGFAGSHVVGGEKALLDELLKFRASVRSLTIDALQQRNSTENLKAVLRECDGLRDDILPSIGVELLDGRVEEYDVDGSAWRFCLPKSKQRDDTRSKPTRKNLTQPPSLQDLKAVPLEDFFRVGQYEGQFSDYDKNGIPLLNSDGSHVSKSLRKKLLKKHDKHAKRLSKNID